MAILRKINLTTLQGRIGDVVVKVYEDKTVICRRASSYKLNYGPAAVEGRNKFSVTAHLSKAISSLPDLKAIWKLVQVSKSTAYLTICKYNYAKSSADKPTPDNIITPGGFKLPVITAAINADKITASISALNTIPIFTAKEVNLSFNAVACFSDPVNPNCAPYELITCSKEIVGFDYAKAYELQIGLNSKQQVAGAKYNNCILYLSAATKAVDGNIVKHSATYAELISSHL